MHFNDLYELISSGAYGGVGRLKTLQDQLKLLSPNFLSLLAGDLFSPSALSTIGIASLNGSTFDGAQMVAAMNELKLDLATLGNHETDVSEGSFEKRMAESNFPWTCINARNRNFSNLIMDATFEFHQDMGDMTAKVGIFGLTLDSNNKPYQSYEDFNTTLSLAASHVPTLRAKSDIVIGLTHLPYWHDQTLASSVPGINIIMGGHEHVRIAIPGKTPIYKADSNVHSAWVHDLWIDTNLGFNAPERLFIESTLIDLDDTLADDPSMSSIIDAYVDAAFDGFEVAGFSPSSYLTTLTSNLDGTTESIFSEETLLTQLFNLAAYEECYKYGNATFQVPQVDATLYNAGAIRIDDTILSGTNMIQYDAIRISPYLNGVILVNMTGTILQRTLDVSKTVSGTSQYLQSYPNITTNVSGDGSWLVNGGLILPERWYVVGILKFVLKGKAPYEFLQAALNKEIVVLAGDMVDDPPTADIRKSLINQISLYFNGSPVPIDGGGDDAKTILGMKVWLFVLILIALVVGAAAVFIGVRRVIRSRRARASSQWEIGGAADNHRAFLASQYSLQQDQAMYPSDV